MSYSIFSEQLAWRQRELQSQRPLSRPNIPPTYEEAMAGRGPYLPPPSYEAVSSNREIYQLLPPNYEGVLSASRFDPGYSRPPGYIEASGRAPLSRVTKLRNGFNNLLRRSAAVIYRFPPTPGR